MTVGGGGAHPGSPTGTLNATQGQQGQAESLGIVDDMTTSVVTSREDMGTQLLMGKVGQVRTLNCVLLCVGEIAELVLFKGCHDSSLSRGRSAGLGKRGGGMLQRMCPGGQGCSLHVPFCQSESRLEAISSGGDVFVNVSAGEQCARASTLAGKVRVTF